LYTDENGRSARAVERAIFLGDEIGTLSVFRHCKVGYHLRPDGVHKIITDGIKRHPLHAEIENDHRSDPFGIESERPREILFSQKTPFLERTEMNFEAFISANIHTVAFS
jgi:hypothetical protein